MVPEAPQLNSAQGLNPASTEHPGICWNEPLGGEWRQYHLDHIHRCSGLLFAPRTPQLWHPFKPLKILSFYQIAKKEIMVCILNWEEFPSLPITAGWCMRNFSVGPGFKPQVLHYFFYFMLLLWGAISGKFSPFFYEKPWYMAHLHSCMSLIMILGLLDLWDVCTTYSWAKDGSWVLLSPAYTMPELSCT